LGAPVVPDVYASIAGPGRGSGATGSASIAAGSSSWPPIVTTAPASPASASRSRAAGATNAATGSASRTRWPSSDAVSAGSHGIAVAPMRRIPR
jgi:hypothetical protein